MGVFNAKIDSLRNKIFSKDAALKNDGNNKDQYDLLLQTIIKAAGCDGTTALSINPEQAIDKQKVALENILSYLSPDVEEAPKRLDNLKKLALRTDEMIKEISALPNVKKTLKTIKMAQNNIEILSRQQKYSILKHSTHDNISDAIENADTEYFRGIRIHIWHNGPESIEENFDTLLFNEKISSLSKKEQKVAQQKRKNLKRLESKQKNKNSNGPTDKRSVVNDNSEAISQKSSEIKQAKRKQILHDKIQKLCQAEKTEVQKLKGKIKQLPSTIQDMREKSFSKLREDAQAYGQWEELMRETSGLLEQKIGLLNSLKSMGVDLDPIIADQTLVTLLDKKNTKDSQEKRHNNSITRFLFDDNDLQQFEEIDNNLLYEIKVNRSKLVDLKNQHEKLLHEKKILKSRLDRLDRSTKNFTKKIDYLQKAKIQQSAEVAKLVKALKNAEEDQSELQASFVHTAQYPKLKDFSSWCQNNMDPDKIDISARAQKATAKSHLIHNDIPFKAMEILQGVGHDFLCAADKSRDELNRLQQVYFNALAREGLSDIYDPSERYKNTQLEDAYTYQNLYLHRHLKTNGSNNAQELFRSYFTVDDTQGKENGIIVVADMPQHKPTFSRPH